MKSKSLLFLFLTILSLVSGVLTAGISKVGKLGVNLFHKEYQFFKIWWQGALVCFIAMLLVYIICWGITRYAKTLKQLLLLALTALFIIGLYFTYKDFRSNISHRWLGERFHLGIYLYWIGFIVIATFFMVRNYQHNTLKQSIKDIR